jgi:hypothetical protein
MKFYHAFIVDGLNIYFKEEADLILDFQLNSFVFLFFSSLV